MNQVEFDTAVHSFGTARLVGFENDGVRCGGSYVESFVVVTKLLFKNQIGVQFPRENNIVLNLRSTQKYRLQKFSVEVWWRMVKCWAVLTVFNTAGRRHSRCACLNNKNKNKKFRFFLSKSVSWLVFSRNEIPFKGTYRKRSKWVESTLKTGVWERRWRSILWLKSIEFRDINTFFDHFIRMRVPWFNVFMRISSKERKKKEKKWNDVSRHEAHLQQSRSRGVQVLFPFLASFLEALLYRLGT